MIAWTAYLLLVALLMSFAGLILERALAPYHLAIRWIWAGALFGSLVLPALLSSTVRSAPAPRAERQSLRDATSESAAPALSGRAEVLVFRPTALATGPLDTLVRDVWALSSGLALATLVAGSWYAKQRRRSWRRELVEGTEVLISNDAGPATVGLVRPRIVIPEWLLTAPRDTLRLVLAHERSHIEARDPNLLGFGLAAVILMPWNPFLWWQLRRLRLAIEVDCDRRVLRVGHDSRRYASTLVDVSTHGTTYLAGLAASPGSGSSVERRIRLMNTPRIRGWRLTRVACALLSLGVGAIVLLVSPPALPPAFAAAAGSAEPADLSRYVGDYEFSSVTVFRIRLQDGQLTADGQSLKPLSGRLFQWGDPKLNAYARFATDASGAVIGAVFEQNGETTTAPRIDAERVQAIDASVREHVSAQRPAAGSEEALRQLLAGIQSGEPNRAGELSPQLVGGTRAILADLQTTMKPWGALRSIDFQGVDKNGLDQYVVRFERGSSSWKVAVDAYGVIVAAETHPLDASKP